MDFFFLIVFLSIYYIRPHEWIDWVGQFRPITMTVVFAIISLFLREKGVRFAQLVRTPHDRLMILYLLWICIASKNFFTTLGLAYHLFIFYFLVVLVAYSHERIKSFVKWWALMIYAIAFLAWASEIGFDPTESYSRTHGARLQGRLVLNTSLFNNPNALGHSVIPLLGIIYLFFGWKSNPFKKLYGILLAIIPFYTIYLTQSKGTYLSGYVMTISMLTLRKNLVMKLGILALMLTVGSAAIMYLPRMDELRRPEGDREAGIEGRVAAWNYAQKCFEDGLILGYGGFPQAFFNAHGYQKPSHSSYVQIGAELSYPGLFFFVGLIYVSLRTLHGIKPIDPEQERIRRVLFILLIAYAASGWTVDFAYRATFFMLVGAIAALHRLHLPSDEPAAANNLEFLTEQKQTQEPLFSRLRMVDIPIMICLTYATVKMWFFLKNWI